MKIFPPPCRRLDILSKRSKYREYSSILLLRGLLGTSAGTNLCCSSRCRRCSLVSANTIIEEPRHFTCKSSNTVYYISCGPYLDLASGKPGVCWEKARGNTLQPTQGRARFARCQTFNTTGHQIDDKVVPCIKQWSGSNNARRLLCIFHLGTFKVTRGKRRFHFEITCSAPSFTYPFELRVLSVCLSRWRSCLSKLALRRAMHKTFVNMMTFWQNWIFNLQPWHWSHCATQPRMHACMHAFIHPFRKSVSHAARC